MLKKGQNIIENYSNEYNKKYCIPKSFLLDHKGFRFIKVDKKTNEEDEILLSTIPFFIESKIIEVITNSVKLEIVFFKNWKKESLIASFTATGSTKLLTEILRDKGIPIDQNNAKMFVNFFSSFWSCNLYKLPERKITDQMGWFENEFIPYSKNYTLDIPDNSKDEVSVVETLGDRKEWVNKVKEYRKNNHFRFILSCGYASVLLKLLKGRSMVIHNNGASKTGKTTSCYYALSIWGNPLKNKMTYTSSPFALEKKLGIRNNIPSLLDEASDKTTQELNKIIYMIGNGKSDSKGTQTGGLRETKEWNCYVLSTSEMSLVRDEQNEGIYNRTIEGKWKPFEGLNRIELQEAYDFVTENYGHTGEEFINLVIKNKGELKSIQSKFENDLNNDDNLRDHMRAVSIICLADYLSSGFFEKASYEESLNLGKSILKDLIKGEDVDTSKKAIEYLRTVISQQRNNFITDINKDVKEPLGHIINGIYHLYTNTVKMYLEKNNFNYKKTKDYLQLNEMACFDKKGDFERCYIDGKRIRIIKLTDNFFEDQEDGKNIAMNDISDTLNRLRNIDIDFCSDSDKEALINEMDRLYLKINRAALNVLSEESKVNQGETVKNIIADNALSELDSISEENKKNRNFENISVNNMNKKEDKTLREITKDNKRDKQEKESNYNKFFNEITKILEGYFSTDKKELKEKLKKKFKMYHNYLVKLFVVQDYSFMDKFKDFVDNYSEVNGDLESKDINEYNHKCCEIIDYLNNKFGKVEV